LLARATYIIVLFFTHIPFVVNHAINATPPERLQQYTHNSNNQVQQAKCEDSANIYETERTNAQFHDYEIRDSLSS